MAESKNKPKVLSRDLRNLDITQADIMRATGLSRSHICRVVNGERYSPTIMTAIRRLEQSKSRSEAAA